MVPNRASGYDRQQMWSPVERHALNPPRPVLPPTPPEMFGKPLAASFTDTCGVFPQCVCFFGVQMVKIAQIICQISCAACAGGGNSSEWNKRENTL